MQNNTKPEFGQYFEVIDKDSQYFGKVGIVTYSDLSSSTYRIFFDDGGYGWFRPNQIRPVPHPYENKKPTIYPEGTEVEILEVAKECGSYEGWSQTKKEMVGEICIIMAWCDDSDGLCYTIYNSDKSDYFWFPHYAVRPVSKPKDTVETIEIGGHTYSLNEVKEALKNLKEV